MQNHKILHFFSMENFKDVYKLGMSFGVRFKVRMFGNKHPDGLNVRIFFPDQIIVLPIHSHVC